MRDKLPDRRPSLTVRKKVVIDTQEWVLLLTVGFREPELLTPADVFCSSFKVGTSLNAIVSDACVLLSRLYQHGDSPEAIAKGLSQPPSLVGDIAAAVAALAVNSPVSSTTGATGDALEVVSGGGQNTLPAPQSEAVVSRGVAGAIPDPWLFPPPQTP